MKIKKFVPYILRNVPLATCFFALVTIGIVCMLPGEYFAMAGALLLFAFLPAGLYYYSIFTCIRKVDGGHITDTIFIDARGIRQESKKGENKFVPWEEVESIRRLTCHRSPPIISVTAADGSRLWWYAYSRKALKYIQSQHPEIPITEPTTREDWGEGEEEQT